MLCWVNASPLSHPDLFFSRWRLCQQEAGDYSVCAWVWRRVCIIEREEEERYREECEVCVCVCVCTCTCVSDRYCCSTKFISTDVHVCVRLNYLGFPPNAPQPQLPVSQNALFNSWQRVPTYRSKNNKKKWFMYNYSLVGHFYRNKLEPVEKQCQSF